MAVKKNIPIKRDCVIVIDGLIVLHIRIMVENDGRIERVLIEHEIALRIDYNITFNWECLLNRAVDYFDIGIHEAMRVGNTDNPVFTFARFRDFDNPNMYHCYVKLIYNDGK
jgi:hypothetical protein